MNAANILHHPSFLFPPQSPERGTIHYAYDFVSFNFIRRGIFSSNSTGKWEKLSWFFAWREKLIEHVIDIEKFHLFNWRIHFVSIDESCLVDLNSNKVVYRLNLGENWSMKRRIPDAAEENLAGTIGNFSFFHSFSSLQWP